jgi:hypothetical protein
MSPALAPLSPVLASLSPVLAPVSPVLASLRRAARRVSPQGGQLGGGA